MTQQNSTQNYEMDFASYLHNPYGFKTKAEQNAVDYFVRKQKIEPSYSMARNLNHILLIQFGDVKKLHREGLDKQYRELKQKVNTNNLMGLIIWGTNDIPDDDDTLVSTYTTSQDKHGKSKTLELTIKTLCQFLKRDYYTYDEIETVCEIYA